MNFKKKRIPSQNNILEIQLSTNEKDIIRLFEKYDQLLRKHSWTMNNFDYDLYSECKITFLKCLKKFNFNEENFQQLYQYYLDSHESI